MKVTQEPDVALAGNYRMLATGFQMSARKLSESELLDENGRPTRYTALPLYFLASHAAELYLKCALLKRGIAEKDLKKFELRHNLAGLLGELLEKKVPISSSTQEIIRGLADQHQNHILRYSKRRPGFFQWASFWPPLEEVFDALEELLSITAISTYGV